VGTALTATRTITSEDIAVCGRLTGDFGSHHVSGLAGRQMAQGLLTLALAPLFLRDGVHMSEVSVKFLAPVFAGDTITATVEIVDTADSPDGLVDLSCVVKVANSEGVPVLDGTARAQVAAGVADAALPLGSR
jgi:acyl dehydratase